MAERDMTPEQVDTALRKLLSGFSEARQSLLDDLVKGEERRIGEFGEAEKRLTATLGRDHARVAALKARAAAAAESRDTVALAASRAAAVKPLAPNEFMVRGHVEDQEGKPVAGLAAYLSDSERTATDLRRDVVTDAAGDFAVVYTDRDVVRRRGQPEVHLTLEDASGQLVYSSRDPVRFDKGRIEHFEVVLAKPRERPRPPRRAPRAPS